MRQPSSGTITTARMPTTRPPLHDAHWRTDASPHTGTLLRRVAAPH